MLREFEQMRFPGSPSALYSRSGRMMTQHPDLNPLSRLFVGLTSAIYSGTRRLAKIVYSSWMMRDFRQRL